MTKRVRTQRLQDLGGKLPGLSKREAEHLRETVAQSRTKVRRKPARRVAALGRRRA